MERTFQVCSFSKMGDESFQSDLAEFDPISGIRRANVLLKQSPDKPVIENYFSQFLGVDSPLVPPAWCRVKLPARQDQGLPSVCTYHLYRRGSLCWRPVCSLGI